MMFFTKSCTKNRTKIFCAAFRLEGKFIIFTYFFTCFSLLITNIPIVNIENELFLNFAQKKNAHK